MHATLAAFDYPQTLVKEFAHWAVVIRPKHVTLGSCVAICKSEATALGDLDAEFWQEFATVTAELEAALKAAFDYDKINYLGLMMIDPQVHFHVFPRYATSRAFDGDSYIDSGWPKLPNLAEPVNLTEQQRAAIQQKIQSHWPA